MPEFYSIPGGLGVSCGRIRLDMTTRWIGEDLLVILSGGCPHIGACALAHPGSLPRSLAFAGHREEELTMIMGEIFAEVLQCKVAVLCGIHYTAITKAEIREIQNLTPQLAAKLAHALLPAKPGPLQNRL